MVQQIIAAAQGENDGQSTVETQTASIISPSTSIITFTKPLETLSRGTNYSQKITRLVKPQVYFMFYETSSDKSRY
jgi:hypothetical protein